MYTSCTIFIWLPWMNLRNLEYHYLYPLKSKYLIHWQGKSVYCHSDIAQYGTILWKISSLSQEHKFVAMKSKISSPFFFIDHVCYNNIIKCLITSAIDAIKLSTNLHTGNMMREFYWNLIGFNSRNESKIFHHPKSITVLKWWK